jgi:hypothetical protein
MVKELKKFNIKNLILIFNPVYTKIYSLKILRQNFSVKKSTKT